eukprot:scaffold7768_cov110-Skeletonema_marinoi.AAC.9
MGVLIKFGQKRRVKRGHEGTSSPIEFLEEGVRRCWDSPLRKKCNIICHRHRKGLTLTIQPERESFSSSVAVIIDVFSYYETMTADVSPPRRIAY